MANNRNAELYKYLDLRRGALRNERVSFDTHWKSLAENIQPRRSRFFVTDRNKGNRRLRTIVNSAGTQAHRASAAGLFAGVMSPTRPWFSLGFDDAALAERPAVGGWLRDVEKRIYSVFSQSNLYNMAPVMLGELLLFGTGCMFHTDYEESVARFYTQTIGSYFLAQNDELIIDTYLREYQMQVGAIVSYFGLENVTTTIKDSYDRGDYDKWHDVCHIIEPRREGSRDNPFNNTMPFRSIYWLKEDIERRILRQGGFNTFPLYAPRWGTTGEDIYGTDCPGMVVLGDVKQLQVQEKRKQQAIDKLVNPPLKGPPSLRNTEINNIAGGITLFDNPGQTAEGLSPLFVVQPQLQEMLMDIDKTERRIQEGFFVDLFFAISNIQGSQYKNEEEILSRNEERLLQLGPVLEQLHGEFLDKLIDRTFDQLVERNMLPPPPPELQGQKLKANYISSLAQAQRAALATNPIDRLTAYVVGVANVNPEAIDKFDFDQALDEYNQALLGPPKLLRGDDDVATIRQQRQQMQQQQMQQEQEQAQAQTLETTAKAEAAANA